MALGQETVPTNRRIRNDRTSPACFSVSMFVYKAFPGLFFCLMMWTYCGTLISPSRACKARGKVQ